MDDNAKTKKTNITISAESEIIDEIKKEATSLGTSLNSVINLVLKEHIRFGGYVASTKPIIIAPPLFRFLLDGIDEERLIKSWDIVFDQITPTIFAMNNIDHTPQNWIKYGLGNIALLAGAISKFSEHEDNNGNIKIVIEHIYGPKWSNTLSKGLERNFEKIFGVVVRMEVQPNLITAHMPKIS